MSNWISVDDKLPEDGQHVLVWDERKNVFSGIGDDEDGRIRMGDCVFYSGQRKYDDFINTEYRCSKEHFLSMKGYWDEWSGQGPCSFNQVTHWMPLPEPPKSLT